MTGKPLKMPAETVLEGGEHFVDDKGKPLAGAEKSGPAEKNDKVRPIRPGADKEA